MLLRLQDALGAASRLPNGAPPRSPSDRSIRPRIRYSASDRRRFRTLSFGLRMPWAGSVSIMPASTASVRIPPRRPTVLVAVPAPPRTTAFPRSFLVLTATRVFPVIMSLRTLLMSVLVRSLTRLVPMRGTMWRSIRPVSVTIVEAFFGRPPFEKAQNFNPHRLPTLTPQLINFLTAVQRIAQSSQGSTFSAGEGQTARRMTRDPRRSPRGRCKILHDGGRSFTAGPSGVKSFTRTKDSRE
ncbi:hypothetical protein ACVWW1_003453 [Bradyrhizobium sp. JR3.5]